MQRTNNKRNVNRNPLIRRARRNPIRRRPRRILVNNRRQRRRLRRPRRNGRVVRRAVLNTRNYNKFMRVVRTNNTSMVVTGMDLVYSVPDVSIKEGSKVLTIIPSNPAYWTGTRISALALGYQQYRPLRFVIHYVPIVSAMQQGNIFGGTIWNSITINEDNLQQSLVTSSGGMSTQVFTPKSSNVRCKDNLSKNLYDIGGELSKDSNPFYYVAIGVGNFQEQTRVTPGYFWVSYTYSFKNPIGNNNVFNNLGITTLSHMDYKLNTTAMLCNFKSYKVGSVTKKLNMFTELQIDQALDGSLVATFNGDYIPLTEADSLWVFQNYPLDAKVEQVVKRFQIEVLASNKIQPANEVIQLPNNMYSLVKYKDKDNEFHLYFIAAGVYDFPASNVDLAYKLTNQEIPQFSDIIPSNMASSFRTEVKGEWDVLFDAQDITYELFRDDQAINIKIIGENNDQHKDNIIRHHPINDNKRIQLRDFEDDLYDDEDYEEYEN